MSTKVVASVVSGHDEQALLTFVDSLWTNARHLGDDLTSVVIANAPSEGFLERIRSAAKCAPTGRVDVVVNTVRRGFAANHNQAMTTHDADYYLISNDDVVVLPGALESLIAFMEDPKNGRVAVATPKLLNADGTVQGCTYSFPSILRVFVSAADMRSWSWFRAILSAVGRRRRRGRTRYWDHDSTMFVDSVRGAFVLIRRGAIDDVGLMDEIAAVGGEELEWHRRMADNGWRIAFVHDAAVVHVGEQTVGDDPVLKVEYVKGWLNYFQKHGTALEVLVLRVGLAMIYGFRTVASMLRSDVRAGEAARAGMTTARRWPRIWRGSVEAGLIHEPGERAMKA